MTISGAMSDLEFCRAQITEAEEDIERNKRRIKFYESEIERIEFLIEKSAK